METLERLIVKEVFEKEQVTERMLKREILFERDMGRFTNEVLIQFVNSRVEATEGMEPGDVYDIGYDAVSRRSERNGVTRFFTSCDGWKAVLVKKNRASMEPGIATVDDKFPGMGMNAASVSNKTAVQDMPSDDLPF